MIRLASAAFALLLVQASVSFAQPVPPNGPPSRPAFSPYLNMLNGGASPALNYFGLVLPQQQFQQQANQLQQQLNMQNQDFLSLQNQNRMLTNGIVDLLLPPTGNVATFNNTGGYFNRIGGGGSIGSGFGGSGRSGMSNNLQPSFARPTAVGSGSKPIK